MSTPGLPDFLWTAYRNVKNIPNYTDKYTKWPQNIISNGGKIGRMAIKCTIFHCKTLQNLPKLGFLVLKIYHLATLEVSSLEFTEMAVSKKSKGNRGAV
jgi:hypothetical protein